MLYGASGSGKSSLVNAGLFPAAIRKGFQLERVRVQPQQEAELVVERIAADEQGSLLPSLFAPDDSAPRIVLSTEAFRERLRVGSAACRPLVVFDQFEEVVTLFEEPGGRDVQRRIAALLVALLHDEVLPVKLLFSFREDYLAAVKDLLAAAPELVDQALRLSPPGADELTTIIRGAFERFPKHYARELTPELAERLREKLAKRFGSAEVSLSEVQTVCLRLWQSDDPEAVLQSKDVMGILEDYLGEELEAFPSELKYPAVALLSQMVTAAGTRNVISAESVIERVRKDDEDLAPQLLERALDRLESESKLVRRERRRDLYLYEITSEFLVPWISRRRAELVRDHDRRRFRRRLLVWGSAVGTVLAIVTAIAVWALVQRANAIEARNSAKWLAVASAANELAGSRLDESLLLSQAAVGNSDTRTDTGAAAARSAMMLALERARESGATAILTGHKGAVFSVAFSPNGRTLASGSADSEIRVWDVRGHTEVGVPLADHQGFVYSVAFSPDGSTLASGSGDGTIRLWDTQTRKQPSEQLTGHGSYVYSVAYSPDGQTLASGSNDGTLRLWEVSDWRNPKPLATLPTGSPAWSVAFSPDGGTLASGSGDGKVRLWDVRDRRKPKGPNNTVDSHANVVYSVAFSPDGRTLAGGGDDGEVRLWDVRNPRQAIELRPITAGNPSPIRSIAFSRDGRTLATGSEDGTARLWDVNTREEVGAPLEGHAGVVSGVAFSPDGRTLATGSWDETVRLWTLDRRRQLGTPLDGESPFYGVAVSSDGQTVAGGDVDGTVWLWDTRTYRLLSRLPGKSPIWTVAFSPDGRTLAAGRSDGKVQLWGGQAARHPRPLGQPFEVAPDVVHSVAFSPDGHALATAGHDTVRLWDVRDRQHPPLLSEISLRGSIVQSLAFSPNGRTLAVGVNSNWSVLSVDVRDLRHPVPQDREGDYAEGHIETISINGLPVEVFYLNINTSHVLSVAFSPDGRTFASADENAKVELWDVVRNGRLGSLNGHNGAVRSVSFSPDGRELATGSDDQTVRLWDPQTRKQLGEPLTGHGSVVRSVVFSPDGRTLVSGGDDGTVRIWQGLFWSNATDLKALVCGLVWGTLSKDLWHELAPGLAYPTNRTNCPG
jgi:WD40 repeat protein